MGSNNYRVTSSTRYIDDIDKNALVALGCVVFVFTFVMNILVGLCFGWVIHLVIEQSLDVEVARWPFYIVGFFLAGFFSGVVRNLKG